MKIMYMKKGISILMAILFLGTGFAQDSKAKEILDKVSSKTNAYKSIAISFKMTISGQGDPITESGKAYLKGNANVAGFNIEIVPSVTIQVKSHGSPWEPIREFFYEQVRKLKPFN